MTHEEIEKHRKRFEALAENKYGYRNFSRRPCGEYVNSFIQGAWEGYLLCAENLVVELPERKDDSEYADLWDDGYNECLRDTALKMKSHGIKVKE